MEDLIKSRSKQYDVEVVERLDLSEARLTSLAGIECAKNLRVLNISGNEISDLTPLRTLTSLTSLNVAKNSLRSLRGIETLESLTELYAMENAIEDFRGLAPLEGLEKLRILQLCEHSGASESTNAVVRHPGYRSEVLRLASSIRMLDGEHLLLSATAQQILTEASHISEADIRVPSIPPFLPARPDLGAFAELESGRVFSRPSTRALELSVRQELAESYAAADAAARMADRIAASTKFSK